MDFLSQYILKINTLDKYRYVYNFEITDKFFDYFSYNQIYGADLSVKVNLQVQTKGFLLTFDINGTLKVQCDRCLDIFDMEYSTAGILNIEYADYYDGEVDYRDTIKITRDTAEINLAKYLYDLIVVGLPIKKVHKNEEECNAHMLSLLSKYKPRHRLSAQINLDEIKNKLN